MNPLIAGPRATSSGSPAHCPARCTTRRPSGPGASWANSRPAGLITLADKDYPEPPGRKFRTVGWTSRNHRKEPTALTRKLRAPDNSPRQSAPMDTRPYNEDEKAHYPTGRHVHESGYVWLRYK